MTPAHPAALPVPRRRLLVALGLAPAAGLGGVLGGCTSVPPTRYYTLARPTPPAATGAPPWPLLVLAPVQIPDLLDRVQRVRRLSPTQVQIDEYALWAQPLREEIAAIVSADLTARWPSMAVEVGLQARAEAPRLHLQLERFETDGREAAAALRWRLQPAGSPAAPGRPGAAQARVAVAAPGEEAAVLALSQALAQACATMAADLADAAR